jgi:hypothetical protein
MIGEVFHKLTVIGEASKKGKSRRWLCRCDCGCISTVHSHSLTSGRTKSCGCSRRERAAMINPNRSGDLSGKNYGRLTVLSPAPRSKHGEISWTCLCSCGGEVVVRGGSLLRGMTKSCGCLAKEVTKVRMVKMNGEKNQSLIGLSFGEWTAVAECEERSAAGKRIYECRCSCGGESKVIHSSLLSGNSKSCGCLQVANRKREAEERIEKLQYDEFLRKMDEIAEAESVQLQC